MNTTSMLNILLLLLLGISHSPICSAYLPMNHLTPSAKSLVAFPQSLRAAVEDDDEISLEAFQSRKRQQEEKNTGSNNLEEFDGYAMRDVILEKWGKCYDVDFNRVDSFGFKNLYLNVLPFHLGGRRFRHETELDYLCHLQAVVEILQKYEQVRKGLSIGGGTKESP